MMENGVLKAAKMRQLIEDSIQCVERRRKTISMLNMVKNERK
jgi:hypothetical protein